MGHTSIKLKNSKLFTGPAWVLKENIQVCMLKSEILEVKQIFALPFL
jgi:hypothetical protein